MHRLLAGLTFTTLAVLVAGCSDDSPLLEPKAVTRNTSDAVLVSQLERLPGRDREFAELGEKIPGFAGFYFDESGATVIRLVDLGQKELTKRILAPILSSRGKSLTVMKFVKADYSFTQLTAWREHFPEILPIEGVTSTSIDKRANRIRIGVANEIARQRVSAKLSALGIPLEAVELFQEAPATFYASLSDYTRPVPGSVQIEFSDGTNTYGCTLGFGAYTNGEADMKFLTNSHCTAVRGQVEYTNYYQPTRTTDSYRIGVEVQDPAYLTGGVCPTGFSCRFSDAAVATFYGASGDLGKLARTTVRSTGDSASMTIDASKPRIQIISSFGHPYVGETLDKIGARTGWTTGIVTDDCADIPVDNIILWCQLKVDAGAWHGDSGSPVFYYYGDFGSTLAGILWGGPGTLDNRHIFYMSSMNDIGSDGIPIDRVY